MEADNCNKGDKKWDSSCKQPVKNTVSRAVVCILSSETATQLSRWVFQRVVFSVAGIASR